VQHAELLRPSPSICAFSARSSFAIHIIPRPRSQAQQWPVPPSFHHHLPTQSSTTTNRNREWGVCTYFLLAICAAVAAFGLSSMAALPESQLPYRSSPPCPSAPLLLILLFQGASAAFVASFPNGNQPERNSCLVGSSMWTIKRYRVDDVGWMDCFAGTRLG